MPDSHEWSREAWEASISGRCWWFTPYDAGWEDCKKYGGDISTDEELKQIVEMEMSLDSVPEWAKQFVKVCVHLPAPCGHYSFPQPCLEALSIIGTGELPQHIHGCYTADAKRKERLLDYLFCLDAWLKEVTSTDASGEMAQRGSETTDWQAVCKSLWEVLGEATEMKRLLVERTAHRYRWWAKTLTWDDDARDKYEQETYLGDTRGSGDTYGNEFKDPYFTEQEAPRVRELEARLEELDQQWKAKYSGISDSWLCGPKSFRILERILWAIGHERPIATDDEVPSFLLCEDTIPDAAEGRKWWTAHLAALDAWWRGHPVVGKVAEEVERHLGQRTPVKQWLVRLYAKRLRMIAASGNLGRLVKPV